MNRKGHVGMALLAFAPVAYVLASEGAFVLAVLCWLGIQAVERLPDQDFRLPVLTHRGVSHSLLAVLVVGSVLGATGWLLGDRLFDLLIGVFAGGETLWNWLLARLPDASADLLTALVPTIPPEEIVGAIQQQAGGHVDRSAFGLFGFFIGSVGMVTHLLGDVITTRGIKPFLPFSQWELSLSPLRADNPVANSALFSVGVLAIALVVVATVPGAVLGAGVPADLSPVGVAAGQSANQTTNQSAASVTIQNQTTNGSAVTIERVTLPDNGFVGIHDTSKNGSLGPSSLIAVSDHLSVGPHRNVTITTPQLNNSQTLVAVPYRDANDNNRFDATKVFGTGSTAFTTNNESVGQDTARVRVRASAIANQTGTQNTRAASVVFSNQTSNGSVVTIKRATLSEPGFVTLHTNSYAEDLVGPNESMIAVSRRLSAGTHRNVTINVSHAPPGTPPGLNKSRINETQTLAVSLYGDSNGNKRLDSIRSFGENDTIITKNGSVVRDSARVRVPSPPRQTASLTIGDQTLQKQRGKTLTVERARLPDGGFLVALNASYRQSGDPLTSVVGVSDYLSPGNHTNVTIDVRPGALTRTQTITIQPARDTNTNQQYDFTESDGFQDVAYEDRTGSQSKVITASARVRVPGSDRVTQPAGTQQRGQTPSEATSTIGAGASPTTGSQGDTKDSGGPFGLSWLQFGLAALVVLILPTLVRRFR